MHTSSVGKAIVAATAIGLIAWFVASAVNGEAATGRAILVAAFVPLVLIWKPLRKRFSGWAIFAAYVLMALGIALVVVSKKPYDWVAPFLFTTAIAGLVLYSGRLKPIEQRRIDVAFCVTHGLWDQLEKQGIPPEEIEQLKKLSPEERAGLMASFKKLHWNAENWRSAHMRFNPVSGHGDMRRFDDDDGTVDFYHGDANEYRTF
ncbi:hypothetical protein [Pelomicrobium sp.]|jgi:hypothetical protein|uniref:hypothetical protein n=1 Tax=Pelomicrobium sp. TaxID=2815319 RepID=UPI002FDF00A3